MLPTLTNASKFLQRDEPLIHVLKFHLTHLLKAMMLRFVSACQVAQSYLEQTLASMNFADPDIEVGHFVETFSLLNATDKDKLKSQFLKYLALSNEDLPKTLQYAITTSEVGHC